MKNAIINASIITVNSDDQVLHNATIVWENSVITAIGPSNSIAISDDTLVLDAKNKLAVMPGLIDCHSHSSLLKGFSENMSLIDWLPAYQREHQILTPDDAYWAASISYLEALKGGTTCTVDMYRYMHKCAEAAVHLGVRSFLAPYVADRADKIFFETLDNNELLINQWHNAENGRIQVMVGLEHLLYCSNEAYQRAYKLSEDYGVFVHTHSSEFKGEVELVVQTFGKRPINLLKERGILTPQTIIAHGVWLNDEELDLLAKHNTSIVYCPTSNAKLAGGSARIQEMKKRNIKVGLGTDGTISNNSLSMWESMKFGSLLQKNSTLDPTVLPATEMIRMATIDGASILKQEHLIGSLEVGKKADLITVDLWQPHLFPIVSDSEHDPLLWNLVFAARASDVVDVWIDGDQVLKDKMSKQINEAQLLSQVCEQTVNLLKRREKTCIIKM